jgi:hypothetical protein
MVLALNGCSDTSANDDNNTMIEKPVINLIITNFEPTEDKIKIDWSLERTNNVIIRNLFIIREVIDEEGRMISTLIANIPSNNTTFTDDDIPYLSSISYKIKADYFIDEELQEGEFYEYFELESQTETYTRDILTFNSVPFQIVKDPTEDHIFHMIDKIQTAKLKKYDALQNKIIDSVELSESYRHNVVMKVKENTIYIADDSGVFKLIDKNTYDISIGFTAEITERLKSFAIVGDRIYYHDDEVLLFYDLIKRESVRLGWAYFPTNYMETIKPNTIFFGGARVTEFDPETCIDMHSCPPNNLYIYNYLSGEDFYFDPFIFSWNKERTKYISSYQGHVMNVSNLSNDVNLKTITGKNYFQTIFDSNNNIYATVQGEKLIHVFNSDYQLIDTIETKLYPLFPIISENGLQCVGSYSPVSYGGYRYGYEFRFGSTTCAMELL